jgi:hypothetical protein
MWWYAVEIFARIPVRGSHDTLRVGASDHERARDALAMPPDQAWWAEKPLIKAGDLFYQRVVGAGAGG